MIFHYKFALKTHQIRQEYSVHCWTERPWLGIWLTICFSGIRGEATEKEWGNDVLTMQPMDWQICKICKYANGLVGWIGWLRRSLGCATTLTRDQEETHARTFSTLKKTHSFFPFLFAQPRRIKTRVFALVSTQTRWARPMMLCLWLYTLLKTQVTSHAWFVLPWFPLTKIEKETGVFVSI